MTLLSAKRQSICPNQIGFVAGVVALNLTMTWMNDAFVAVNTNPTQQICSNWETNLKFSYFGLAKCVPDNWIRWQLV